MVEVSVECSLLLDCMMDKYGVVFEDISEFRMK